MTAWPQLKMQEDICVLEEQLRLARKWYGQIASDLDEYNKLIAQLEESVNNLTARAERDGDS